MESNFDVAMANCRSPNLWANGETISSNLVTVKSFIRTKIIVTFPSGTESIDLADQELLIVSTNEADRQLALANFNQLHSTASVQNTMRSKSKSPGRSRPRRTFTSASSP